MPIFPQSYAYPPSVQAYFPPVSGLSYRSPRPMFSQFQAYLPGLVFPSSSLSFRSHSPIFSQSQAYLPSVLFLLRIAAHLVATLDDDRCGLLLSGEGFFDSSSCAGFITDINAHFASNTMEDRPSKGRGQGFVSPFISLPFRRCCRRMFPITKLDA